MIRPSIIVRDTRWKPSLRPYCKTIESVVSLVKASGELAVVLADDAFVQGLNRQYRGKDKPPNVLSFPNEDEPLGDVVLSYDTITREASEQGKDFRDHALHLLLHGILHLMGYDHEQTDDADKMEAQEVKLLKKLGITNPYL